MKDSQESWLFYLVLDKQLDEHYLQLSRYMGLKGISLIPVNFEQFQDLVRAQKNINVLACSYNLDSHHRLSVMFKRFFRLALKTGSLNFIHLSSFSAFEIKGVVNKDCYEFYRLPIDVEYFTNSFSQKYFSDSAVKKSWPGARIRRTPTNLF